MHNIDFTLENQNGLKAKDTTGSRKILDIIAWYENNTAKNERDNDRIPDTGDLLVIPDGDENEEEEPADSSYTASPNFNDGLGNSNLSS